MYCCQSELDNVRVLSESPVSQSEPKLDNEIHFNTITRDMFIRRRIPIFPGVSRLDMLSLYGWVTLEIVFESS